MPAREGSVNSSAHQHHQYTHNLKLPLTSLRHSTHITSIDLALTETMEIFIVWVVASTHTSHSAHVARSNKRTKHVLGKKWRQPRRPRQTGAFHSSAEKCKHMLAQLWKQAYACTGNLSDASHTCSQHAFPVCPLRDKATK